MRRVIGPLLLAQLLIVDIAPAEHVTSTAEALPSAEESGHEAWDELPSPGPEGSLTQELWDFLGDQVMEGLATVDSLATQLAAALEDAAPQHPSPIFVDGIAADGRIGGFDDWFSFGPADPWRAHLGSAASGQWSYASTTSVGYYPHETRAFLVSPMLDLTTTAWPNREINRLQDELHKTFGDLRATAGIPKNPDDGTPLLADVLIPEINAVEQCVSDVVRLSRGKALIELTLSQRYSLASGQDYGRLWAFLERPSPSNVDDWLLRVPVPLAATLTAPSRSADSCIDSVSQLFQQFPGDVAGFANVAREIIAPSASNEVTGAQQAWRTVQADLSSLAGRRIWLAFELDTGPVGFETDSQYFGRRTRFPVQDFYGWWIDDLRIEGPAVDDYVRVFDIPEPSLVRNVQGQPQILVVPGAETNVSVRVHNAGSRAQTSNVTLTISGGGNETVLRASTRLGPGEVRSLLMPWRVPSAGNATDRGAGTAFAMEARLSDQRSTNRAAATGEDEATLDVLGAIHRDLAMSFEVLDGARGPVGDVNEPRQVRVTVTSLANVPLDGLEIVTGFRNASSPSREVAVGMDPPGPIPMPTIGVGDSATVNTMIALNQRGLWELELVVREVGSNLSLAQGRHIVGVRSIPSILFRDDHADPPSGLGYAPTLERIGDPDQPNQWSTLDLFDPGPGSYWRYQRVSIESRLRGSPLNPNPSANPTQVVLNEALRYDDPGTATLADFSKLELSFDYRRLGNPVGSTPPLQVLLYPGVSARIRGSLPFFPDLSLWGPSPVALGTVTLASLPTKPPDSEWQRHPTIDVKQFLGDAGFGLLAARPQEISIAFQGPNTEGLSVLVSNVDFRGLLNGQWVPLLRTSGSPSAGPGQAGEMGYWSQYCVAPCLSQVQLLLSSSFGNGWSRTAYTSAAATPWHRTTSFNDGTGGAWYNGDDSKLEFTAHEGQRLISPVIDLTGAPKPSVQFSHKYSMGSHIGRIAVQSWNDAANSFDPPQALATVTGDSSGMVGARCLDGEVGAARWDTFEADLTPFIGRVVRLVFDFYSLANAVPAGWSGDGACGWFIGSLMVRGTDQFASDLRVDAARFDIPSYDPFRIGLGPGTQVPVAVSLSNPGLFPQTNYTLTASLETLEGAVASAPTLVETGALEPGTTKNYTLGLDIPVQEGSYRLRVVAQPDGQEDFLDDNQVVLGGGNSPLEVRSSPDLEVDLEVTPQIASTSQGRFIVPIISNVGNQPLEGVQIQRSIAPVAGAEPPKTHAWELQGPLGLGASIPLQFLDTGNDPYTPLWLPPGAGDFDIEVTGTASGEPLGSNNLARIRVSALDVLFSDGSLEVKRPDPRWAPDVPWFVDGQTGFDGTPAWRLGNGTPSAIPIDTNAALRLPLVDLSNTSAASLTFLHRFELEPGYDGGIVEGRLPGGPWRVLQPRPISLAGGLQAYPAVLQASNPLTDGNDPRAMLRGYSGSSQVLSPQTDGWIPAEFDLSQMPELVETQTILSLAAGSTFAATADAPPLPGTSTSALGRQYCSASWGLPDDSEGSCQDGWFIESLKPNRPMPRGGTGKFAWSGTTSAASTPYWTNLTLKEPLDLPPLAAGAGRELRYHEWLGSSSAVVATPTPPLRSIRIGNTALELRAIGPVSPEGWTPMVATLPPEISGENLPLLINYTWTPEPNAISNVILNDGWAIDDLTIISFNVAANARTNLSLVLADEFADLTSWEIGQSNSSSPRFGAVSEIPTANPAPWRAEPSPDENGISRKLWTVRNPANGTAPNSIDARLTTPLIDLTRSTGTDARMRLVHKYDFETYDRRENWEIYEIPGNFGPPYVPPIVAADGGIVEVQVFDEATGSWGPWVQLYEGGTRGVPGSNAPGPYCDSPSSTCETIIRAGFPFDADFPRASCSTDLGCTRQFAYGGNSQGWVDDTFDLAQFIGKKIRVGLHVYTNPTQASNGWWISRLEISGQTFVGQAVELRLRAGTDESEAEGHWTVDNVLVAGKTFAKNVGVYVDEVPSGGHADPGGDVRVTGIVRNLGRNARESLNLCVSQTAGPPATLLLDPPDVPGSPGCPGSAPVRLGPFNLAPAGAIGDHHRFAISVRLSGTPAETQLELSVMNGTTTVAPVEDDEIPFNLERQISLDTRPVAGDVLFRDLTALPNPVPLGEPIHIRANLSNPSSQGRTVEASLVRLDDDVGPADWVNDTFVVEWIENRTISLPAFSSACETACLWEWAPETAGLNILGLAIQNSTGSWQNKTSRITAGHTLVHWRNGVDDATESNFWEAGQTPRTQSYNGGNTAPVGFPFLRSTSQTRSQSNGSLLGGITKGAWDAGGKYPSFADGFVRTGVVDLRGAPTESGRLTFWHQPHFNFYRPTGGYADGGVVEVCILTNGQCDFSGAYGRSQGWIRLYPEGGYAGRTPVPSEQSGGSQGPGRPHPLGPETTMCNQTFCHPNGVPIATGASDEWVRLDFDLANAPWPSSLHMYDGTRGGDTVPAMAQPTIPILGNEVRFRFRVGTWTASGGPNDAGQGWLLDDFQVSSYRADVEPAFQRHPVVDGASKTFALAVRNSGAASDRFAAVPREVPTGFTVTTGEPVPLDPGEEGVILVRVDIPIQTGQPGRSIEVLELDVIPVSDPLQGARATIQVDYSTRAWPDLLVEDLVIAANPREGVPSTLAAVITNVGTKESPPALVRLYDRSAAAGAVDEEIDSNLVPSLEPGEKATVALVWTPVRGSAGVHVVRAEVNADQSFMELPFGRNRLTLTVAVAALQRPDLVVRGIQLLDPTGPGPADVKHGSLVRVRATLANEGTGPATAVTAVLLVDGFPVKEFSIPRMAVNESVAVEVNWPAVEGSHNVSLLVRVPVREWNETNNVASLEFFVPRVAVIADLPATVPLGDGRARIEVPLRNPTQQVLDAAIEAVAPPGWTVHVSGDRLRIPAGESGAAIIEIRAPSGLASGTEAITVLIRDGRDGAIIFEGRVHLGIPPSPSASLAASFHSAGTVPGQVAAVVRNTGNARMELDVGIVGPPGWPDTAAQRVVVEAGNVELVNLPLNPPVGVAPGSYMVEVEARTGCCIAARDGIHVDIGRFYAWSISMLRQVEDEGALELLFGVRNDGNAPGVARLALAGLPSAWEAELQPSSLSVPPGETQLVAVRVRTTNGPQSAGANITLVARSEGARADSNPVEVVDRARPPTALVAAVPLSNAVPMEDQVAAYRVDVQGAAPGSRTLVAFFVDDLLIDARSTGPADPLGRANVTFRWVAEAGRHLVAFQVDPTSSRRSGEAEATVLQLPDILVAPQSGGKGLLPGPSLILFAAALAAAFILRGPRAPGRRRT